MPLTTTSAVTVIEGQSLREGERAGHSAGVCVEFSCGGGESSSPYELLELYHVGS